MTVLLDSYCWFEYYFGSKAGSKIREIITSGEEILVTPINVYEVYRKYLQNSPTEAEGKKSFMLSRGKVINITGDTAVKAAELSARHGLHATDALIYAAALENDCTLITGDAHLTGLPNVKKI